MLSQSFNIFRTTALVLLLSLSHCSKSGSGSSDELLGRDLLQLLPSGTMGFLVWDYTLESAKRFQSSPFGAQEYGTFETIRMSFPKFSDDNKGSYVVSWIMDSPLFVPTKAEAGANTPPLTSTGVSFLNSDSASDEVAVGMFLQARAGASDLSSQLNELRSVLESKGAAPTAFSLGEVKGFSLEVSNKPEVPDSLRTLYVAANSTHFTLSTSQKVLEDFFAGTKSDALTKLRSSANFSKASQKLGSTSGQFTFGYFDLLAVAPKIERFVPELGVPGEGIPLSKLGTSALVYSREMPKHLSARVVVLVDEQKAPASPWMSQLKDTGSVTATLRNPKTVVATLGLSGKLLSSIKDALLAYAEPAQEQLLSNQLAVLSSVDDLSLGITSLPGGSLFPSALLLISSKKPDEVLGTIKQHIKLLISSSGMPLSSWQKKKLGDREVEFILSPLGVGLFLLTSDKGVIIATSEQAAKEAIEAGTSNEQSIGSTMSSESKKLARDENSHFMLYVDGPRLGSLIEAAQGNLSMFTGGNSSANVSQIEKLKAMGGMLISFQFDGDAFIVNSLSDEVK